MPKRFLSFHIRQSLHNCHGYLDAGLGWVVDRLFLLHLDGGLGPQRHVRHRGNFALYRFGYRSDRPPSGGHRRRKLPHLCRMARSPSPRPRAARTLAKTHKTKDLNKAARAGCFVFGETQQKAPQKKEPQGAPALVYGGFNPSVVRDLKLRLDRPCASARRYHQDPQGPAAARAQAHLGAAPHPGRTLRSCPCERRRRLSPRVQTGSH